MNSLRLLSTGGTGTEAAMPSLLPIILIYAVFGLAIYFFLFRPNNKKKKKEAEMRKNVEIGDQITTIGGIVGRIVAVRDDIDSIMIETGSDRNKMMFKRWAISSVDTIKDEA